MIVIISETIDSTTNDVIDWLLISKNKLFRVNKFDIKINFLDFVSNEIQFKFKNNSVINSHQITSFWYRRGYIGLDNALGIKNKNLEDLVYYDLIDEWGEIIRFFTNYIESNTTIKSIGNYNVKDKKLDQLYLAKKAGLNIPETLITTQKSNLISFYKKCNKKIITKGINKSPSLTFKNISLEGYTEEVTQDLINNLSDTFFASFFQENIIKQYELRIFFLKDKFFAMAIFSQNDEQTKTDMRKYNDAKPSRTVPYLLPKNIEEKLKNFTRTMNLNTGSIDMIVDNNDDFYFLEVNPNGQFGMVSVPCNYYIEREIAKELL